MINKWFMYKSFKNYFEGKNKIFWNLIYCYFVAFLLISLSCCIMYIYIYFFNKISKILSQITI